MIKQSVLKINMTHDQSFFLILVGQVYHGCFQFCSCVIVHNPNMACLLRTPIYEMAKTCTEETCCFL